jgi:hypothetical protein
MPESVDETAKSWLRKDCVLRVWWLKREEKSFKRLREEENNQNWKVR